VESPDFLDLFITESREHLEGQSTLLAKARARGLGQEEVNDLFRHAHSLKGMAQAMGFKPIGDLAHAVENLLHDWRDRGTAPAAEVIDLLIRSTDRLAAQVDAVAAGGDAPPGDDLVVALRTEHPSARVGGSAATPEEVAPTPPGPSEEARPRWIFDITLRPGTQLPGARAAVILKRLQECAQVIAVSPDPRSIPPGELTGRLRVTLTTPQDPDRLASAIAEDPDVSTCRVAPETVEAPPAPAVAAGDPPRDAGADLAGGTGGAGTATRSETIGTIRVATERMDHLLDGIGELILDRERLERSLDPEPGSPLAGTLESLGRTVDALRDEVMQMRLLPFASVVPRLQRAVRDLAERLGKEVNLEVRGTDVALDRSILEDMTDPLQHILRNSIDHGIEEATARQAAGKPPAGRIEIDLSQREGRVNLSVADDGRGIDPAALRRVAVERRFISRKAAERMSDDEALMLITLPGFSTAARTTEISGRGVGMDVVRMRVQKLGGRLTIRSRVGAGTRLEMDLPPAVTVTRAFLCRARGEIYAVPVSAVQATLHVRRDAMQPSRGEQMVRRDSGLVTLLPLGGILAGETRAPYPPAFPALVYEVDQKAYALAVDEILGEEEIVVKPLRHPLELLPHYAGAAVLNDGQIALIVDPVNLTRTSRPA
jgi:two-component system, chemotaxis family, sensor kinase CheA